MSALCVDYIYNNNASVQRYLSNRLVTDDTYGGSPPHQSEQVRSRVG